MLIRCGGQVGMYLIIKKAAILLLHDGNGYFINPPYLDTHGEVDLGLKYVSFVIFYLYFF